MFEMYEVDDLSDYVDHFGANMVVRLRRILFGVFNAGR
jgi:hypothetical protein